MKFIIKNIVLPILASTVLAACNKEYTTIEALDAQSVQEYIQKNNLNVQQYEQTGIFYQVIKEGTGDNLDFTVKTPLLYTLATLDGKFVSKDTFTNKYYDYFGYFKPDMLREVVNSKLLKQGGIIRVIVPSRFAFGKAGTGSIPGNSSLDYTITAIKADKIAEYDDFVINTYLQANNLTGFTKSASGLYYKIALPGDGVEEIDEESAITVEYQAKLFNGTVFDKATSAAPATFSLKGLIEGWKEGLPLIKKGGSIRLIVPSALAYGLAGNQGVPPFSCLDFDIKVTDVAN